MNGTAFAVIDLRSDTITKPPPEMLEAMMTAQVGDDVYAEDPTVNDLEQLMATMMGKEAGLFFPTGTMGNLVSVMAHCWQRGQEVLLGDLSHIHMLEQGNISQLGSIHARTVTNKPDGTFCLDELRAKIRHIDDNNVLCSLFPVSSVICLENTHNLCSGSVLPEKFTTQVSQIAKQHNLKVHLDGARLFNAAVAQQVPVDQLTKDVDSVSVCFSKGLCCPLGNVVVGTKELIGRCHRLRKAIGGSMRQSGYAAGAAIYGIKNLVPRLADDHDRAYQLATAIETMKSCHFTVDLTLVHTNIVFVNVNPQLTSPQDFANRLLLVTSDEIKDLGYDECCVIKVTVLAEAKIRLVTSREVDDDKLALAIKKLRYIINDYDRTRSNQFA